jgi:hypothetical protein
MERLSRGCRVSGRHDLGARGRIGVADPLEVMQTIEIEVGLIIEAAVRDDARDDLKVEAVIGQIKRI